MEQQQSCCKITCKQVASKVADDRKETRFPQRCEVKTLSHDYFQMFVNEWSLQCHILLSKGVNYVQHNCHGFALANNCQHCAKM